MSLILSDNSVLPNTTHTTKTSQTVATAESSFTDSSVIPASSAFSGAVFHGGHLNITINMLNKSPNTSKCSVSTVAWSEHGATNATSEFSTHLMKTAHLLYHSSDNFCQSFSIDSTIQCFRGHYILMM